MLNGSVPGWGSEIRRFRLTKFVKQSALAETLNVDQATVSRWERNISVPDMAMQRRLRALIQQPLADEFLLKHAVTVSLGQLVISNAERVIQVVSAGYSAAHGLHQAEMPGRRTHGMYTEEGERLWQESYRHGFYRGDVASVTILCRSNSLSGHRRNMPTKVVWTPIRLASGEVILRGERVDLPEHEFASQIAENRSAICIVTIDDLAR